MISRARGRVRRSALADNDIDFAVLGADMPACLGDFMAERRPLGKAFATEKLFDKQITWQVRKG